MLLNYSYTPLWIVDYFFNKSRSPFFQHYAHFFRSALNFFPFVSESLNTGYEGIVYTFTELVVAAVLVLLGYNGEGRILFVVTHLIDQNGRENCALFGNMSIVLYCS